MESSLGDMIAARKQKLQGGSPDEIYGLLNSQSPDAIQSGIRQMQGGGNPFGTLRGNYLGDRANQIYNQRLGSAKSSILRNAVFADADRQQQIGQLGAGIEQRKAQERLIEAQRKAAKKARKKSFGATLGGIAGGIGGAMIGGPAGAQVGAGLGSAVGGSF